MSGTLPEAVCPGLARRRVQRHCDNQRGEKRGDRSAEQPTGAAAARRARAGATPRCNSGGGVVDVGSVDTLDVVGIGVRTLLFERPEAGGAARRRRGRRRRDAPELQPGDEVALAEGEVVAVGEVTGQVLGVGVGQRPVEEVAALLEGGRVGRVVRRRNRPHRRRPCAGGPAPPRERPRPTSPPTRGSSQTSSDQPRAGGSRTMVEP